MQNIIIDFNKKYTFGEMVDKLSKNSTLSFYRRGKLYFKRNGKFLTCEYNSEMCEVVHSELMEFTEETTSSMYYETDFYVSSIVFETTIADVKKYLLKGYIIMLAVNGNTWTLELEDNVVFLDYSEVPNANEDNYKDIFTEDILISFLEGQWFVIDADEY